MFPPIKYFWRFVVDLILLVCFVFLNFPNYNTVVLVILSLYFILQLFPHIVYVSKSSKILNS